MKDLNRRTVVAGISAMGLGAAALSLADRSSADTALERELNLDDPASNLEAYIKLRGDIAGAHVYDMVRGQIYGLIPGQAARPLFKTVGAGRASYTRVSSLEYQAETRYVGILLDWETEQPLERWLNPYTEKRCQVPVTQYGPSKVRLLPDRTDFTGNGASSPPPAIRPWFLMGGMVHILDSIISPVAESLRPDADLMTYSGDARLLADPRITGVPSQLSFTAVESWRDWMAMELTGSLWWHVSGVKLADAGDYPAELRSELRRLAPDFLPGGG